MVAGGAWPAAHPAGSARTVAQAVAQDDVEEQDEQFDVDEEQVDPNSVSELSM